MQPASKVVSKQLLQAQGAGHKLASSNVATESNAVNSQAHFTLRP